MYGVTGCSGHSMAVTGWLSLERRDQDPRLHACIFFDVFQGSTTLRLTGQSYLLCQPALPACCLSVCLCCRLCLVSASVLYLHTHILFPSSALSQHIRNTAQRIASHCIESLLVTVQCFFSLPLLLSFVASVPGPVPVLILLFCLRHQHHDHRHHHHINRSLVSPTTAAIHDPHAASSGSHVTEIA